MKLEAKIFDDHKKRNQRIERSVSLWIFTSAWTIYRNAKRQYG